MILQSSTPSNKLGLDEAQLSFLEQAKYDIAIARETLRVNDETEVVLMPDGATVNRHVFTRSQMLELRYLLFTIQARLRKLEP